MTKSAPGPIAFESAKEMIYLVNDAAGAKPVRLTEGFNPVWSPDEKQIAFDFHGQIWTINADGSHKREITRDAATSNSNPTWSPDGKQIAFMRWYTATASRSTRAPDIS